MTSANWSLRFKLPQDLPCIGKFNGDISTDLSNAKKPLKMFYREEHLNETLTYEEELEKERRSKSKSANKRNRFNNYKTKKTLILQDSVPSNQTSTCRYEGKHENTSLSNSNQVEDGPFKYVLLSFVKSTNEVNVIPVESLISFQKHGMIANETLEEVKDKIEIKMHEEKAKIAKYRRISHALSEKKSNNDGDDNENEEYVGGFESQSLFNGNNKGGKSNKPVKLSSLSGLFSDDTSSKSNRRSTGGMLDENGIDLDELKELENNFKGDYSATFADDDEADLKQEQGFLDAVEELGGGTGKADRYLDEIDEGDDDGLDALMDDDNDDDNYSDDDSVNNAEPKGMVNQDMEKSIEEARKVVAATDSNNKSNNGEVRSAMKRTRDDNNNDNYDKNEDNDGQNSRVSFNIPGSDSTKNLEGKTEKVVKKKKISLAGVTSGGIMYELSDEGVKKYINNRGGKVLTEDLKEVLRDKVKAYSDQMGDKKAGGKRLLDICLRLTDTVDDPVMGRVLVLKQMYSS
eukprot:gene12325-16531_t